jgi:hypothetical protein
MIETPEKTNGLKTIALKKIHGFWNFLPKYADVKGLPRERLSV